MDILGLTANNLTPQQREDLIEFYGIKARYMLAVAEASQSLAMGLSSQKPFSEIVDADMNARLAKLREEYTAHRNAMIKTEVVDTERLQESLPMLVAVLMQSVNVSLLLQLMDFDPQQLAFVVNHIKEFVEKDMP